MLNIKNKWQSRRRPSQGGDMVAKEAMPVCGSVEGKTVAVRRVVAGIEIPIVFHVLHQHLAFNWSYASNLLFKQTISLLVGAAYDELIKWMSKLKPLVIMEGHKSCLKYLPLLARNITQTLNSWQGIQGRIRMLFLLIPFCSSSFSITFWAWWVCFIICHWIVNNGFVFHPIIASIGIKFVENYNTPFLLFLWRANVEQYGHWYCAQWVLYYWDYHVCYYAVFTVYVSETFLKNWNEPWTVNSVLIANSHCRKL